MFCQRCNETSNLEKSEAKIYDFATFNGSGNSRQAIATPFKCNECGEQDQSLVVYPNERKFSDKGVQIRVLIKTEEDLKLQVFRSNFATICVPEIEFEIPPTPIILAASTDASKQQPIAFASSIGDILKRSKERIESQQPVRRILDPELATKLDEFIAKLNRCISLEMSPYTFVIDDSAGHSTVVSSSNNNSGRKSAATQQRHVDATLYTRTREQNMAMLQLANPQPQQQVVQASETETLATATTSTAAETNSNLPEKNEDYASKDYWNKRYTTEESYDWFNKSYKDLQHILDEHIDKETSKILHIGCGNSKLGIDMIEQGGYNKDNVINMDYSDVIIQNMAAKYPDYKWRVMDVLNMNEVQDGEYDIVLDKATMDALFADEKSDTFDEGIDKMCKEVLRILKPGGKYIQISFGQPHLRKRFILRSEYEWDLEVKTIGEFFHYFIYILTKRQ